MESRAVGGRFGRVPWWEARRGTMHVAVWAPLGTVLARDKIDRDGWGQD